MSSYMILPNAFRRDNTYLLKPVQKFAEGRTLPNPFYKDTITLIPKPEKNISEKKERKLQANIIHRHAKVLNKILANRI